MRHTPSPEPGTPTPTSWQAWKERAKSLFEREDFEGALTSYGAALNPDLNCPAPERAIVLSNMVACRLKIGGPAQERAAVENAKKCVALNDKWAKGHVRLASAYVALGGHSNDACNALQRALKIDPGNSTARQMLLRELRRDGARQPTPSAPPEEFDADVDRQRPMPSAPPSEFDERDYHNRQGNNGPNGTFSDRVDDEINGGNIDDSIPVRDRLSFYADRISSWYQSLSPDMRSLLKVGVVLLFLYVGLGGRFGFEGQGHSRATGSRRGRYDGENAYDQYYRDKSRDTYQSSQRRTSDTYGTSRYDEYSSDYYGSGSRHNTGHRYQGGGSMDTHDSGLLWMVLLGGVALVCYRFGLNPLEVFFYLNMLGVGPRGMRMGGGRFRRRGFGAGVGFGHGGFGFGRGGFQRGHRNRWF